MTKNWTWNFIQRLSRTTWKTLHASASVSRFKAVIRVLTEWIKAHTIYVYVFSADVFVPALWQCCTSNTDISYFSLSEAALHSLLRALTSETQDDPTQHLEREQALAKQFAEILHFTLRFDELKVRPSIPPTYPKCRCLRLTSKTHLLDVVINSALFSCDTNQTF